MSARSMRSLWRTGQRLLRVSTRLLAPVLKQAAKAAKPAKPTVTARKKTAATPLANPGALERIVHVPPGLRRGAPLVVLLHGCDQEPLAMAEATGWRQLADKHGFVLLMPRQISANNSHRCFNWYRTNDIARDHGEAASIRAMITDTIRRHKTDPQRVFATGLSAGGAMTSCLLAAYPDVFAAGAVVAGMPAGSAHNVVSALTRMGGHGARLLPSIWATRATALGPTGFAGPWPRLSVWHGTADSIVAPSNGTDLVAQWGALQSPNVTSATAKPQTGVTHTSWTNPSGTITLEYWEVQGMQHCYPAATMLSPESVIPPAPIWAAAAIARFWGIDKIQPTKN